MSEPLSPWDRVEAALAVMAVDPAGVKGLWLRARSGPVRDVVMQGLPVARRIHPGIDDVALFGGVDLAATLAAGQVQRSLGILTSDTPLVLTMAERCPPALAARLSRWLDDSGPCLVALDEGAEAEEILAPALADRLGLFLDLGDLAYSDVGALALPMDCVAEARGRLAGVVLPVGALESLTTVAAAMGIASLRAPLLAV